VSVNTTVTQQHSALNQQQRKIDKDLVRQVYEARQYLSQFDVDVLSANSPVSSLNDAYTQHHGPYTLPGLSPNSNPLGGVNYFQLTPINTNYSLINMSTVKDLQVEYSSVNVLDTNCRLKQSGSSLLIKIFPVESNLSLTKQSRWLVKNLPVSRGLSESNFAVTNTKKMIGNLSNSLSASTKNI